MQLLQDDEIYLSYPVVCPSLRHSKFGYFPLYGLEFFLSHDSKGGDDPLSKLNPDNSLSVDISYQFNTEDVESIQLCIENLQIMHCNCLQNKN